MCTMSYAQCCWMCVDSVRNYAIENLISIINDVGSKQTHKTGIPVVKLKQKTAVPNEQHHVSLIFNQLHGKI